MSFSLRLGEVVPNFECHTTQGDFKFHDFIKRDGAEFTVLMSHPADYTPVCTTELGRAHARFNEFKQRGVNLIGISCDTVDSHKGWSKDILHREKTGGEALSFPVIADDSRDIVTKLGMLDPRTAQGGGSALPARALVVFDNECKVRLAMLYPASTGRSFDEVFRVLDSLILNHKHQVATPADWHSGDRVIVPPGTDVSKFKNVETEKLPSGKEYLRFTGI